MACSLPKYFFANDFDTTMLFGSTNALVVLPSIRGIENTCRKLESATERCSSLNCLSLYFTKSLTCQILVNAFTSGNAFFIPSPTATSTRGYTATSTLQATDKFTR